MSRYMIYKDAVRPSDSYLLSHPNFHYDPEEWFDDDYDLDEDLEVLTIPRTCDRCGCSFTIEQAIVDYSARIDFPYYALQFIGDLCGNCAADSIEKKFES